MITELTGGRVATGRDHGPLIHIYDDGHDFALCGHPCPRGAKNLPWVHGIHDCERCWEIHDWREAHE